MHAYLKQLRVRIGAWLKEIAARFGPPRRSLAYNLRLSRVFQGLAQLLLGHACAQEALYRTTCSYHCIVERKRHLIDARRALAWNEIVLKDAVKQVVEIEAALSLPAKRGQKPDKLDQQNLRAVKLHLAGLEETTRRLSRLLEEQERKQLVPALV